MLGFKAFSLYQVQKLCDWTNRWRTVYFRHSQFLFQSSSFKTIYWSKTNSFKTLTSIKSLIWVRIKKKNHVNLLSKNCYCLYNFQLSEDACHIFNYLVRVHVIRIKSPKKGFLVYHYVVLNQPTRKHFILTVMWFEKEKERSFLPGYRYIIESYEEKKNSHMD